MIANSTSAKAEAAYITQIKTNCGASYTPQSGGALLKMWADDDATDTAGTLEQARLLVKLASECIYKLPDCDGTVGDCDDAAYVAVSSEILEGEYYVARSLAVENPSLVGRALSSAFAQVSSLCKRPTIIKAAAPYISARATMVPVLRAAALFNRRPTSDGPDIDAPGLKACSDLINANAEW
jgi:hypothetical protein